MRSLDTYLDLYVEALARIDPEVRYQDRSDLRLLGQTELCLAFLHLHIKSEPVRSIPSLMMGYPALLPDTADTGAGQALFTLRHLTARFGSVSAWMDALRLHREQPEHITAFDARENIVRQRRSADAQLLDVYFDTLGRHAPWTERRHTIAKPGDAKVYLDHGQTELAYKVPTVSQERQAVDRYVLPRRAKNPPIQVRFSDMLAIAAEIDAREAKADWPSDSLPPLNLKRRLKKLKTENITDFYDGETFTLNGATHLVGMLSSGKSTFVAGLVYALTLGPQKKRIAMLANDTMQAAALMARLRRHGIAATVVASWRNRETHLQSLHWQRSVSQSNWDLSQLGDLAAGFSTACPLDGHQEAPEVIAGETEVEWRHPGFREKQCHAIYQAPPSEDDPDEADADRVGERVNASSCPLWAVCPAQAQARDAVTAEVLIMTPAAFVHMRPDPWTTRKRLSFPELLQFEFDLVIVDEVDGVQKSFDDIFSPRAQIMGDSQDTYAPSIGLKSSEALRRHSGAQFRKPVNAKWQSSFFTFFRLIGTIYAILQNESRALGEFYRDTPFTAGSILYDLWRKRLDSKKDDAPFTLEEPGNAREFLEVIKVAGAINRYAKTTAIAEDEDADSQPKFEDAAYADAAAVLQDIARELIVTDFYDQLLPAVETALQDRLTVFRANSNEALPVRSNALAIILAVVTDLALAHYNWLVKTQAAVASDFQIDDGYLLGGSSGLIKDYRTLLPANPSGAAFGLFYDAPGPDHSGRMGGKLTLLSHLGVGRHLLTHMHDLLAGEGQAGPHTLMLSGTSWAGGSVTQKRPQSDKTFSCASPSYDVQVPVKAVLVQPEAELDAIKQSLFTLINSRDREGRQLRVSGASQQNRRDNLGVIASQFATRSDGLNRFERDWAEMEARVADVASDAMHDRRRALLVTNSYADAEIVAATLAAGLRRNGYEAWDVHCLVRDSDEGNGGGSGAMGEARPLPRSLVERFGDTAEHSILIAPMSVIARGHNILNGARRAAISSIYFMHRVHPRPDDLSPTIGRLNRFAEASFQNGLDFGEKAGSVGARAAQLKIRANHIVRHGLEAGRGGYKSLPVEYKAQFAWDLLTPLWQTIGRGIRGGSPVFVGFVDRSFAEQSFAGSKDTPESSVLVQCIRQLALAIDSKTNPTEHDVARLLYQPFFEALSKTRGLIYDQD